MRYLAYLALSLSLASCSIVSSTPVLNDVLASKGDTRPFEQPLPINTQPKRLALGHSFAVGVKEDGTVWSWGYGMLGLGKFESRPTPQAIPNMTDFVEVAVGSEHVLALRKDGTVWSWGDNKKGQLGYQADGLPYGDPANLKYDQQQRTPKQIPDLKDVVSIGAGGNFSLALDKSGDIYAFGSGGYLLGEGVTQKVPKKIHHIDNAVRIIAGWSNTAVLTKKGELWLWGDLGYWLGTYKHDFIRNRAERSQGNNLPWLAKTPLPVADFSSAYVDYVLLQDGSVWAAGSSSYSLLGQGNFSQPKGLVKVKNIGRITHLQPAMVLDEKGTIWQWGAGVFSDFGAITGMNGSLEALPIRRIKNKQVVDIYATNANAYFLADGSVWFYGNNFNSRGTGEAWKNLNNDQHDPKKWNNPEKSLWTWK
ncbi:MAG: hypothetical protein IPG70_12810 [Moraxellaceae bacterium]|nr:hypothetical protein [Moraxellaceae bacterium]